MLATWPAHVLWKIVRIWICYVFLGDFLMASLGRWSSPESFIVLFVNETFSCKCSGITIERFAHKKPVSNFSFRIDCGTRTRRFCFSVANENPLNTNESRNEKPKKNRIAVSFQMATINLLCGWYTTWFCGYVESHNSCDQLRDLIVDTRKSRSVSYSIKYGLWLSKNSCTQHKRDPIWQQTNTTVPSRWRWIINRKINRMTLY